ncbi:MAG: hypothetical protein JXR19_00655 [Bacteroidia bacterium]
MSLDLSIIITSIGATSLNLSLIDEIHDVLTENDKTHEILLLCSSYSESEWKGLISKMESKTFVKCYLIKHNNELSGLSLCGLHLAQGRYLITLNSDFAYSTKSIIAMHAAIEKSNCQIIYGTYKATGSVFMRKLKDRILRLLFFVLSGMPSYISNYRIMDKKVQTGLKLKTPYYFLLDHLIKPQIENHAHLNFEGVKAVRSKWNIVDRIFRPLAWTIILEIVIVGLLLLNIWVLLKGRLMYALLIALIAVLFVFLAYLLKWRRRIAYKILAKHP